ncbi:RIP homotypic interaction motif-containing protein [Amycolatopsis sp. GM8]|uniref:RIP homotypic interaction motif-containing protein n=1 Tax=Amycolatopsis sp. GM8 TaxID=2896530 RepID=UPI001F283712|nr:RIP homotypic interaction motif-containing protein [Amycolatopsis sp. GM8]
MDLVVTALTAGAAAGIQDTTKAAVKDVYDGLLKLVRRRIDKSDDESESLVDDFCADPKANEEALKAALLASDVGNDEVLIAAAQRVLEIVDPDGAAVGKYTVDIHDSKGVQIGDQNTMNLNF